MLLSKYYHRRQVVMTRWIQERKDIRGRQVIIYECLQITAVVPIQSGRFSVFCKQAGGFYV